MLKKSFIMYAAKMVGYALRLILPYFLVRFLTKADFGSYRQFFLIEVTILAVFQFGVNQALYYFIPRDEKNAGSFYLNSIIFNIIIYTGAFALIRLFAARLSVALNMPLLVEHFGELAIFGLFVMIYASSDSYLTARQKIKMVSILQVVKQLNLSIVTLVVAIKTREIAPVFLAMTVMSVVNFLMITIYIQIKLQGFRSERYFFDIMGQLRYGVVLGFGGSLWVLQSRIHELFISRYFGQENYAVYSAGCTQIPIIDFFVGSITAVTLGQLALMEKNGDWQGIASMMRRIMTSLFAMIIPGVLILLLFSKPLILFMFTDAYSGAVEIFRINTLVKVCFIWNAQLVLRAMDRNDIVLYVMLVVTLLTPLGLFVGMHFGGMAGVITAQLLMMILGRVAIQFVFNRIAPVKLSYFVRPADILILYRDSYRKGLAYVRKFLPAAS